MRRIAVLGLVICSTWSLLGQNSEFVFEQITSEAGITFNAVSSIAEDEDGFLWFGTASGLYHYNTSEITQYSFDPLRADTPPSNKITNLYKDTRGRIWVCTDHGVCYFDESTNAFIRHDIKDGDKFLNNKSVTYLLQYQDDVYLIVIEGLLYHFAISEPVMREIKIGDSPHHVSFLGRMENDQIYVGTADGKVFLNQADITDFTLFYQATPHPVTAITPINRTIWIGFEGAGVDVVDAAGERIMRYRQELSGSAQIASNRVREIVRRKNGQIWIGSGQGISVIDSGGIHNINQSLLNGLPHIAVFELYVDRNDGVWVGTWSGGLAYYNEHNYKFPHIRIPRNNEDVSRSVVSSFAEDDDGNIWVGIENYSLERFDPTNLSFIKNEASPSGQWPVSRIKSISAATTGHHWMGTLYEGLWHGKNKEFRRIGNISGIFSSVLSVDDGVWIGTRLSGLIFYDPAKNTFEHYRAGDKNIGSISSDQIWHVYQDSGENLWVCSDFGLSVKYKDATQFERFFYHEHSNSLSRNLNYTITEDKNGELWIGTAGAGIDIYNPKTRSFRKFSLNASIENAEVYSILQDQQANMWFSTNQGIYVYYPRTNTLRSFKEHDGILGKQYHPNSGFISSSGKLFFGGGNGFNIIDPPTVKQNPLVPEVFLSKLLINNKPLTQQKPRFINSQFPAAVNSIELAYNQNSLTIGLVANNFIKSSGNRFRYRMENYLDDWIETTHNRDVSFTKIPPGNYTLEVLAANSDGVWGTVPKEFHIKIAPPFWLSWYAYLFYGLLLVTTCIIVWRELRFREASRADKTLFSEKVKFFTNVSHEFRTPLTLVIAPLNSLMKKLAHDPPTLDQIKVIKRNADRLLHLTNQVLDFQLIELNKIKLKRSKDDIVELCRNAYDCFEYELTAKQLNCIFNSSFKSFYLEIDAAKIEKVIYNLMANALKHAPEKGQIILSIEQVKLNEETYSKCYCVGRKFRGSSLEIRVKDNGPGIGKDKLPRIFDRFFTGDEKGGTGIGIGLHMCQEYIQLHGGNIIVISEEGNGTIFIVNIPIEQQAEFEKEDTILQYYFDQLTPPKIATVTHTPRLKTNKLLLYVEDNDELRVYFKNLLSVKYKVLTAKNGQQALDIAREVPPDIIISDILMPAMDGLELTDHLRKSVTTAHVPVILLTALSDEAYQLESMSKGANTFITKPVDESLLFAQIDNLLQRQEAVKKSVEGQFIENVASWDINEPFLEKARRIVDKNLQNPSFAIAEFATQLGISRSSLQRRMKAEVNLSPTEFIRDIRLNKSIELMKSGTYNIDEIGLLVGFNSTSYFIRTFKKKYGKTPFAFQSELKVQKL